MDFFQLCEIYDLLIPEAIWFIIDLFKMHLELDETNRTKNIMIKYTDDELSGQAFYCSKTLVLIAAL